MNTQEKEEPRPVTPESLAEKYITSLGYYHQPGAKWMIDLFLAGYHTNAKRNADIAQRLDLAEESLKRHGFERAVVKGVVTWVTTKLRARLQPCGCVTCICDDPDRCHGCGAKSCDKTNCVFNGTDKRVIYSNAPSYEQLFAEIAALKIAAADYAKAAEASTKLVEKLTRERNALRDTPSPVITALEEERDTLRTKLSAANEAREKAEANYRVLGISIQHLRTSPFIEVMNQTSRRIEGLEAALEKAVHERNAALASEERMVQERETWRKEVAQLKQHLSNQCDCANRWEDAAERAEKQCDDLRRQLWEAKRPVGYYHELLQWQAAAGKMREAAQRAMTGPPIDFRPLQAALSTPIATALLEGLEGAFREAVSRVSDSLIICRRGDEYAKELWLSSETRKRYSGGTEAGA